MPSELLNGHWTAPVELVKRVADSHMLDQSFLTGSFSKDNMSTVAWSPFADCAAHNRTPAETLGLLREQRAVLILSGNSIMRHLFFRTAAWLGGKTDDTYTQNERAAEKDLCTKEVPQTVSRAAGNFRKPFCKSGCCGVCSCHHTVAATNTSLYFVWQQEWYDDNVERSWNALLGLEHLRGKRIYMLMNAGLVRASRTEHAPKSLECLVQFQFPRLREWLQEHALDVHTMYLASTPEQGEAADVWLGAQDGMLRTLLSGMPQGSRPVWLDARALAASWVGVRRPRTQPLHRSTQPASSCASGCHVSVCAFVASDTVHRLAPLRRPYGQRACRRAASHRRALGAALLTGRPRVGSRASGDQSLAEQLRRPVRIQEAPRGTRAAQRV